LLNYVAATNPGTLSFFCFWKSHFDDVHFSQEFVSKVTSRALWTFPVSAKLRNTINYSSSNLNFRRTIYEIFHL
jgi:hypothetical protein